MNNNINKQDDIYIYIKCTCGYTEMVNVLGYIYIYLKEGNTSSRRCFYYYIRLYGLVFLI
jgi:hypothetical protein